MNPKGKRRILILGVTGMLGHVVFRRLLQENAFQVLGVCRSPEKARQYFSPREYKFIHADPIDALVWGDVSELVADFVPDFIINCIGIIKQVPAASDPVLSISINSLFPHCLDQLCASTGTRLIHISTDCVFDGDRGNYLEDDEPTARDLYGRSKALGEVRSAHAWTLRTSIIGHELATRFGLVEWFLAKEGPVSGFRNAIFTGFPAIELAEIILKHVIQSDALEPGLYQVASDPISKYDLLGLIARTYGKRIEIIPDDLIKCDRSLNPVRFREAAGFVPPPWPELVRRMFESRKLSSRYLD